MILRFRPRKRFGQNFLHESATIRKMVQAINPQTNDHIIEIGPGLGALTQQLLPHLKHLTVLELDRDLIPLLKTQCMAPEKLIVYEVDAMKFDFRAHKNDSERWRVVGNLPYNISTALLFHLLQQITAITDMHFMLQNEVVDRITARAGDAHYGRLSVMTQYYCQVKKLFTVKPGAFQPPPAVCSAVIRLVPHRPLPYRAEDPILLSEIVRLAFTHRRKILRNSLGTLISSEASASLGINDQQRPEELSVSDYVKISNFLKTAVNP